MLLLLDCFAHTDRADTDLRYRPRRCRDTDYCNLLRGDVSRVRGVRTAYTATRREHGRGKRLVWRAVGVSAVYLARCCGVGDASRVRGVGTAARIHAPRTPRSGAGYFFIDSPTGEMPVRSVLIGFRDLSILSISSIHHVSIVSFSSIFHRFVICFDLLAFLHFLDCAGRGDSPTCRSLRRPAANININNNNNNNFADQPRILILLLLIIIIISPTSRSQCPPLHSLSLSLSLSISLSLSLSLCLCLSLSLFLSLSLCLSLSLRSDSPTSRSLGG